MRNGIFGAPFRAVFHSRSLFFASKPDGTQRLLRRLRWKATCFADKIFCTFAVSIYLRFSFNCYSKYISFFWSKGVFWPPILVNLPSDNKVVYADVLWWWSCLCFCTCVDKALYGLTNISKCLFLNKYLFQVLISLCCLFLIAMLIVSSIIHQCRKYINRTGTVHGQEVHAAPVKFPPHRLKTWPQYWRFLNDKAP